MFGDSEYFQVFSKGNKIPYYMDTDTGEVLYVNGDINRKVKQVKSYDDKRELYTVVDEGGRISAINEKGIEQNILPVDEGNVSVASGSAKGKTTNIHHLTVR